MKHRIVTIAAATVLAALALSIPGCEDSGVIAPSAGQIIIIASPVTLVLDPPNNINDASSTISAQVLDEEGYPVKNVNVAFSTSSGTMQSANANNGAPTAVRTDSNGVAQDVLLITITDPEPIQVSAISASLSAAVDLQRSVVGVNQPPTADAFPNPPGYSGACTAISDPECVQQKNGRLDFDGRGSSDPDSPITCYKWVIENEVYQGPTRSTVDNYDTSVAPRTITASLFVSDDIDPNFCPSCQGTSGCGEPNSRFSAASSTVHMTLLCNLAPVADAGDNKIGTLPVGQSLTFILDGSASTDTVPGSIDTYNWDCGNGTTPVDVTPNGSTVQCIYDAAGVYTATLVVADDGDGMGGCIESSSDSVTVTVNTIP